MKRKYLQVEALTLSYLEQNPTAPSTIVFIHGNSGSAQSWRKQYASPLLQEFRHIILELPGHGSSTLCEPASCSVTGLARICGKALELLHDDKPFILAGISLATNIIAEMLAFQPVPKGLVLAGPCIVGKEYPLQSQIKNETHVHVVFQDEPDAAHLLAYVRETSVSTDPEDLEWFIKDFKAVQSPLRSMLAQSIAEGKFSDEVTLISESGLPVLLIFGEDEKIIETSYLDTSPINLWEDQIFKISGASHLVNIDQPMAFNQLLARYGQDILHHQEQIVTMIN
jgi:pimeloyl-ACP methyl ester carboxylesterase